MQVKRLSIGKLNHSIVTFNVLIVGEPCCGKSTFVQSFARPYVNGSELCADHFIFIDVVACSVHIDESAFSRADELRNLLLKNHNGFLATATNIATTQDQNALDKRIHCLVYMFGPHRVLQADRDCLKSVAGLVPIVPVLAKVDTLTAYERQTYLTEIYDLMAELGRDSDISVQFQFIEYGNDDAGSEDDSTESGYDFFVQPSDGSVTSGCCGQTDPAGANAEPVHADEPLLGNVPASSCDDLHHVGFMMTASPEHGTTTTGSRVAEPQQHSSEGRSQQAGTAPCSRTNVFALVCSASESGLREYPWGCSVSAYDERVSDLRRLQRLVFERGNIARLRDLTQQMTIALHSRGAKLGRRDQGNQVTTTQSSDEPWGCLALAFVMFVLVFWFMCR